MNRSIFRMMILSIALSSVHLQAQLMLDVDALWMNDDNVENNVYRLSDRILASTMRLAYLHEADTYELEGAATLSMNYYSVVQDRSFVIPDVQLKYGSMLDDDATLRGELSLAWLMRSGRNDYAFLDYTNLALTAAVIYQPSETRTYSGTYQYKDLSFSQLSPFNYAEHTLTGWASFNFESRTTLIFRGGIGTKLYAGTVSDTTVTYTRHGGGGRPTAGAIQTWGSIRIAQGITEQTGLSLTMQGQQNLRNTPMSLSGTNMLASDEEIFDDRYGYEGWTLTAMVTHVLGEGTRARIAFTEQQKSYVTLGAYDLAGVQIAELRSDRRTSWTFSLHQEFSFGAVDGVYEYIQNTSNDPYYNYPNSAFTLQLSVPFGR